MQPTLKDKEWFCCKNVWEILQFKDSKDGLFTKAKQAYKSDLRSFNVVQAICTTPLFQNAEKAVYISRLSLYQLIVFVK